LVVGGDSLAVVINALPGSFTRSCTGSDREWQWRANAAGRGMALRQSP
jgi:hypothetical protein